MATEQEKNAEVIIRRVKKGGHDAHHGGAWKVAYADFVTAMMSFFLLLWLLQATTEEQKLGIADYFAPASVSRAKSGSGGLMGGRTFTKEGESPHDQSPVGVMIELATQPPDWDDTGDPAELPATEEADGDAPAAPSPEQVEETALEEFLARREAQQFAAAEQALRQAIESVPELNTLANNLIIDQTSEGMRIQIVDEAGEPMFPLGSAEMYDHTRKLLALVVGAVHRLPQRIAIKGHTDATPYVSAKGYSNWELSTDRANSSRRALVDAGLSPERIASVVGRADQEHLDEDDPYSPRNRRISIILLRETSQEGRPAAGPGSGQAAD
ncbi:MAG: flagellar motor protein MotB [Kiloniellaceae bacterium]